MTPESARMVANTLVATGAVVIAAVVLRTPRLRRIAVTLATTAVMTTLPAYLFGEVRKAWDESAHTA